MTQRTKTPVQLNRMKFRNQIDSFGDLVVGFSVERRLIVSSANEIFGTSEPILDFDELAGHFRPWALTHYPAFADLIDSALRDARVSARAVGRAPVISPVNTSPLFRYRCRASNRVRITGFSAVLLGASQWRRWVVLEFSDVVQHFPYCIDYGFGRFIRNLVTAMLQDDLPPVS